MSFRVTENSWSWKGDATEMYIYDLYSMCLCVYTQSLNAWLFVTSWAVAHQAALFIWFSRQEYWSGFLFPSPGDLPDLEIKSMSLVSPASASRFLPLNLWEALCRVQGRSSSWVAWEQGNGWENQNPSPAKCRPRLHWEEKAFTL